MEIQLDSNTVLEENGAVFKTKKILFWCFPFSVRVDVDEEPIKRLEKWRDYATMVKDHLSYAQLKKLDEIKGVIHDAKQY